MTSTKVDYKSTIFLPKTDFPMKGDLPINEPKMLERWKSQNIYQKIQLKNQDRPKFTLPDGPPYANGSIHMGHALNKILKDIILKYKSMQGFASPFIPGWDCHGLPIEHKVMKDLSQKKTTSSNQEILELCRKEALHWVETQKTQFQRLGILADWDHPYLTLQAEYEAEEVREFARAFRTGSIYRGAKPVYWNWHLQTALADAEVEYHPHKSPSIYVKFPIHDKATVQKLGSPKGPVSFVIWTTTPWTLPANVALCLHPDLEYGLYKVIAPSKGSEILSLKSLNVGEYLVLAKGLAQELQKSLKMELDASNYWKGAELEGLKARHPWIDRDSLVILGNHVTLDAGTGVVHTAPGHGADDFRVGSLYHLPALCPVNDKGEFTSEIPDFEGLNIFKANPLIVAKLQNEKMLVGYQEFEHSYPHCWRSKTPLIFRTTPQWFLGLDIEKTQIRKRTLVALSQIQFFPEWGEARLRAMMENRPDWCLSRQRIWGVPIPVFYCLETGEPLADYEVMMRVADVVENEGGISAFFNNPPEKFIGDLDLSKYRTELGNSFGSKGFKQGQDILDVWFDSGVCHAAVQEKREGLSFPADLYLEGSDQHRGWFNTSLLTSMTTRHTPPFKALVTHGFVVDSQGRKMSKSLGNIVDPLEVIKSSGAEIIRLWAVYEDYSQDMNCGKSELSRVTETYRRVRNTMRFLLGSLSDFDYAKHQVPYEQMTQLDKWALHELNDLIETTSNSYDRFEFYRVYHALNIFFTVTLSATYLDILKDRLYTWKKEGHPRRSAQTALYHITNTLMSLMAPILSFLAEEVYTYWPYRNLDSIFQTDFPKALPDWKNQELKKVFDQLLKVRSDAQKELESLRNQKIIGSSLEASLSISAPDELFQTLTQFSGLRELLIVSEVCLKMGDYQVVASAAPGEKCVRCWTYSTQIKHDGHFPDICPKCIEALS